MENTATTTLPDSSPPRPGENQPCSNFPPFSSSVYINWNNPGSNKFKATWKKVASKRLLLKLVFHAKLLVVCCSSVRMESSGGAGDMYSDFMVTVRLNPPTPTFTLLPSVDPRRRDQRPTHLQGRWRQQVDGSEDGVRGLLPKLDRLSRSVWRPWKRQWSHVW